MAAIFCYLPVQFIALCQLFGPLYSWKIIMALAWKERSLQFNNKCLYIFFLFLVKYFEFFLDLVKRLLLYTLPTDRKIFSKLFYMEFIP